MNKNIAVSAQQHWTEYRAKNAPYYAVLGHRGYLVPDGQTKRVIPAEFKFMVLDENFQVIESKKPYDKRGEFTRAVNALLGKNKREILTGDNVETLIDSQFTSAYLTFGYVHGFGSRSNPEKFPAVSPEFAQFEKITTHLSAYSLLARMNYADYDQFSQKQKKDIDEAIQWSKTNKSLTPIQDAFHALLISEGVNVTWKPSAFNTAPLGELAIPTKPNA